MKTKELQKPLFLITLGVFFIVSIYLIWKTRNSSNSAEIIVSVMTLFATIMVSMVIQHYQSRQKKNDEKAMVQQVIIELFKEFRSPQMRRARTLSWQVKKKWDTNPEFRQKAPWCMVIETEDKVINFSNEERKGLFDLLSFYKRISLHDDLYNKKVSSKIVKQLNCFYYFWWRRFLYEIVEEYDRLEEKCISKAIDPELRRELIKNVTFQETLERMDKMCGLTKVAIKIELHDTDLIEKQSECESEN